MLASDMQRFRTTDNGGTMSEFRVNDQVVIRRKILGSPSTNEVKIGKILNFSADGRSVVVSVPEQGGRTTRQTVTTSSLEPVKSRFGRTVVQNNPVHRQISLTR